MASKFRKEFLARLRAVTGKRPRVVIDHIFKHGQISTEELKEIYGYNHPPRAVKDVTDLGIPIVRLTIKGKDGRRMAAYTFGDPATLRGATYTGRRAFPKKFKVALIERYGCKCALCSATFLPGDLQIDHRVPYEVAGESPGELNIDDYMLVCRTCNRGKSWSCEHCKNWKEDKKASICQSCFWGSPDSYQHIALRQIRRLHVVWSEEEVNEYDDLTAQAKASEESVPEYVKKIIRRSLRD